MKHNPILIKNLSLLFPHKTCFEGFDAQISYGDRIAIIGKNGSGKSTLLKIIMGTCAPTDGFVKTPKEATFGYVPQIIEGFDHLSGGERLNKALTRAIAADPNILCLDEPTNHLDLNNRKSIMQMLKGYRETLIIISHDGELLRSCINTLWHIEDGKIHIFSGNYDDYIQEVRIKRAAIETEITRLNHQKNQAHQALMKEEQKVSKSRTSGKKKVANKKWMKSICDLKAMKAEKSQGSRLKSIESKKRILNQQLSELHPPEVIVPRFQIIPKNTSNSVLVSISEGGVSYNGHSFILKDINMAISASDRIAITGDNGSGKSTLIKAILNDPSLKKAGSWHSINQSDIGYLDQHYNTLPPEKSVIELISQSVPDWSHNDLRRHLNNFLFRKNEEVNCLIDQLSGGEKARLSLAQIAAKPPGLLILDEITNNLDLENLTHVEEVLNEYPGAILMISHDNDFMKRIKIKEYYKIENSTIRKFPCDMQD